MAEVVTSQAELRAVAAPAAVAALVELAAGAITGLAFRALNPDDK